MKKLLIIHLSVFILGIGGFAYGGLTGPTGGSGLVSPAFVARNSATTLQLNSPDDSFGIGITNLYTPSSLLEIQDNLAGASVSDVVLTINNASTTAADPYIDFQIASSTAWLVGVDDSDANSFRIATSTGTLSDGSIFDIDRLTGLLTIPGLAMSGDINLDGNNIDNGGVIFLKEQADADADVAGSGQIWVDTATPNVLFFTDDAGTDFVVAKDAYNKRNKSVVLDAPVDADTWLLWKPEDNITITDIYCITDPTDATGEDQDIDIRETDANGDSGLTVDAVIVCTSGGAADDGTLSNGTIDAGDWVQIDIGVASGTIPMLTVDIWYTID